MSTSKKFAKTYAASWDQLQELVKTANNALESAKAVSDATGLPFQSVTGLYVPDSFKVEFYKIDLDFVETLTDIASWQLEDNVNWRSSSANC
jgi:hypothetical protein